MKIIYIILFTFFVSCNNTDQNDAMIKKLTIVDTLKTKLLGQWGGREESAPVWEIRVDSIYYYEEKRTYQYKLLNKDLIIERDESKGILRNISVIEDTMTFNDEHLIVKGYRFKIKK